MQPESPRPGTPPPPIGPVGFFTGVEIRPIVIGIVIDYVSTYLAMFVYVFVFLARYLSETGEVSEETLQQALTSTEGLLIGFAIGALCTALGGYVAGRKAATLEVKHGALVGFGSLVVSTVEQHLAGQTLPIPEWYRVLALLAIIPAGAVGGYLAELTKGVGPVYRPPPMKRPGL